MLHGPNKCKRSNFKERDVCKRSAGMVKQEVQYLTLYCDYRPKRVMTKGMHRQSGTFGHIITEQTKSN